MMTQFFTQTNTSKRKWLPPLRVVISYSSLVRNLCLASWPPPELPILTAWPPLVVASNTNLNSKLMQNSIWAPFLRQCSFIFKFIFKNAKTHFCSLSPSPVLIPRPTPMLKSLLCLFLIQFVFKTGEYMYSIHPPLSVSGAYSRFSSHSEMLKMIAPSHFFIQCSSLCQILVWT